MANTKSAIKRIKIAERNRARNKAYSSAVKTLNKKCLNAIDQYGKDPGPENLANVQVLLSAAYSKIDKAVKRNVLHANNGARKKARLAKAVKKGLGELAPTNEVRLERQEGEVDKEEDRKEN